jgi:hypothetical protein
MATKAAEMRPEEFRALVAGRIQHFFGMSLDEFARAFRAGELDERPIAFDLALLAGVKGRTE